MDQLLAYTGRSESKGGTEQGEEQHRQSCDNGLHSELRELCDCLVELAALACAGYYIISALFPLSRFRSPPCLTLRPFLSQISAAGRAEFRRKGHATPHSDFWLWYTPHFAQCYPGFCLTGLTGYCTHPSLPSILCISLHGLDCSPWLYDETSL